MYLQDDKPADHRLALVYRYGTGAVGLILLVFGIIGLFNDLSYVGTTGIQIAGLSTNGLLSTISVLVAAILTAAAARGGHVASNTAIVFGALFFLSGLVNYGLMWTSANFLAFRLPNVVFSFVVGLVLAEIGMYGRFTAGLPHDNPYWLARHPEQAQEEERRRAARALAATERLAEPALTATDQPSELLAEPTPAVTEHPAGPGAAAAGARETRPAEVTDSRRLTAVSKARADAGPESREAGRPES
jgi:hypothetical protein